jgi:hypothetical protein
MRSTVKTTRPWRQFFFRSSLREFHAHSIEATAAVTLA